MKEYIVIEKEWNYHLIVWPIAIIVILFIIWASISEIDEIVHAKAKVVPSSSNKILQHLEGGIVEEIYVNEGASVKKGDFIYKLKNTLTQSDSKEKEIELIALEYKRERLKAQIEFKDNLKFDKNNIQTKNEIAIFESEMQNYKEQKKILENELHKNRLEKQKNSTQLKNLRSELRIQKENLKILDKLLTQGAASKKQYLQELAKNQTLITKINEIKNSIPMIEQKIESTLTKIKKLKIENRSKWLKELSEVELNIEKLIQKKLASKDREIRKIITSPVNGVVQKLYFHTIGGIVKPGDRVAEITPIDDSLIIEARVKPKDRGSIRVDQNVSIDITAYSYAKYGLLSGKVISISPDSFIDNQGEHYYEVKIKAERYSFAPNKPILPGMMANVNIKTGKKTIMAYILKPLKDIQQNALTEE